MEWKFIIKIKTDKWRIYVSAKLSPVKSTDLRPFKVGEDIAIKCTVLISSYECEYEFHLLHLLKGAFGRPKRINLPSETLLFYGGGAEIQKV